MTLTHKWNLTLYGPNSFFVVFRDIDQDSFFFCLPSDRSDAHRKFFWWYIFKNRIENPVKGDTFVLQGVQGLKLTNKSNSISNYLKKLIVDKFSHFFNWPSDWDVNQTLWRCRREMLFCGLMVKRHPSKFSCCTSYCMQHRNH